MGGNDAVAGGRRRRDRPGGLSYAAGVDRIGAGARFGGRYRLQEQLATDEAGWTFAAVDTATGHTVTLDVFGSYRETPDRALRQAFEHTMRAAARVDHGNVVRVLGAGVDHGRWFVATAPAAGRSLTAALTTSTDGRDPARPHRRRFEDDQVVALTRDLVEALVAVHRVGVVHGAISSDTVFVDDRGGGIAGVALVGFGRALVPTDVDPLPGTPAAAPAPTVTDDLVGLAEVARQMLGRRPAPAGLDEVLERLDTAGTCGYRDATEAQADLAGLTARPPGLSPASTAPSPASSPGRRRSLLGALPLGARVVLGLLGVGVVVGLGTLAAGRLGFRLTDPPEATVPEVAGATQEAAEALLAEAGLSARSQEQQSAAVPKGSVISQEPTAGTTTERGDAVTLVISTGGREVTVPHLVGLDDDDAIVMLDALGLVAELRREGRANLPEGEVYDQLPSPDDVAQEGESVLLFVAGPR